MYIPLLKHPFTESKLILSKYSKTAISVKIFQMHLFCTNWKDIHKFEEILLSDDQRKNPGKSPK